MHSLHRLEIKMTEFVLHFGQVGIKAWGVAAQIDKNNMIPDRGANRNEAGRRWINRTALGAGRAIPKGCGQKGPIQSIDPSVIRTFECFKSAGTFLQHDGRAVPADIV